MSNGRKTLFSTYWSSSGWRHSIPDQQAFEEAKAEGYMFDPAPRVSHEEAYDHLQDALSRISPEKIADAFLYSLSTRRLEYRSAMGSYYYAAAIPPHGPKGFSACGFCRWTPFAEAPNPKCELAGYNVFNFERLKWGGVRHSAMEYALFDLQQFLLLPEVQPTDEDRRILKAILESSKELLPTKRAGAYQQLITKKRLLPSNKAEIDVLLDILGICGVLTNEDAPCWQELFSGKPARVPVCEFSERSYPVNYWRAENGVNKDRFLKVFGMPYEDF